jgi:CheY-like chemotaxis protein/anti-sigma regulatory factor (Ser/Thr protein kinase)
LVAEVCEVVRELAARNRVQFVTEIDAKVDEVELDPGKTKQVLYNYLSNAIKFTHGGTVTVRAYPVDDQFFRVEVEDTGIGISAEDQRRLFAEFQQLDEGAAKKYQGTGLGLALTKRIVEAQGGMVGVESTPGQGSTFFAILPLRAPGGGNGVQAKPADARARLVLVVEDDPVDAQTLVDTLEGAGYRAIVASTGTDAIQEVNRRHFDAVTLDLLLPDMAGWNVLKAIQSSELNADTVTIVVSVSSDQGMARGFKVNGTIAKPVDKDHLLGTLRNAGIWPNLSRRVLVVDDDPSVLKLMETSLTDLGYVPVCVGTAEAGALVVQHDKPDAVILDFMLPGMSGLEFLSTFRQNPDHVDVPVVLWTNKDLDKKELAKLKHLGTQVVLKRSGGIRSLLEEIQERLQVPPVTTSDRESGGDS